jgi:hypothetical protein
VWTLNAANRPHANPWEFVERYAAHNNRSTDEVWADFKLSPEALARDPLS